MLRIVYTSLTRLAGAKRHIVHVVHVADVFSLSLS